LHAALVFHLSSLGGPSRSLTGLAAWLAESGRVTALFPDDGPAAAEYRRHGDVVVTGHSALTRPRAPADAARAAAGLARDVAGLRRELRRLRPDLVVVVTTVLPAALVAARLEGVPAVVYAAELHAHDPRRSRAGRAWGGALLRGSVRLAAGIVCCSELVASQFAARGTPLAVAYPPIGPDCAAGDRERGRARHGLDGADPCIALVGSLSPGRGQDVALRALPAILEAEPQARMLVVGGPHPRRVDRDYAAELRRLASELGVDSAVRFAGPVTELADVYAAADMVVNPARVAESFGRVVPEALRAGRPAISTDVGAVREVVTHGEHALLVAPDDPGAIAAAVLRLRRDPELAERLVRAGASRVEAEFGPEQDLAAWRGAIERATAG
jgi:glycosyltransferase involved in cell wall biosynthesis